MKKYLLSILSVIGLANAGNSQCAVTSAPNQNCNYGFTISGFTLNSVASTGNGGCGSGGYNNFATPVRALTMGINYTWRVTFGNSGQSFAIWIDMNGDNQFSASENIVNIPYSGSTSLTGNLTIPYTAVPGTGRKMRLRNSDYTNFLNTDMCTSYVGYYGEVEDYLIDIIAPPPCSGTPLANSVVTPTYAVCPNQAALLGLTTTYTTYGFTYQWQSSTVSNVGPFTNVPGGTGASLLTPTLNANTYYNVVVTCTNSNQSITASAGQVTVATTTYSTVPYLEDFEKVAFNGQLPNCSWKTNNANCLTYTTTYNANRQPHSGTRFASFGDYNGPPFYQYFAADNYFYTNGIQLNAGITYSASMWFTTEYYGYTSFDLKMLVGASQSTTGLSTIYSAGGGAASAVYKQVGNTFTVATSGIYYIAVNAKSSGQGYVQYLSWDDLEITAPCSLNTVSVALNSATTTVCSGETINFTAAGADTYMWSDGSTGSSITPTLNSNTSISVVGTNTTTGCTNMQNQYITVNPTPVVSIITDAPSVCSGSAVHLTAFGATNYTWNATTNPNNPMISVSPTVNTAYQVIGAFASGCSATSSQQITVLQLPNVSAVSSSPNQICVGESASLTGNGAVTYEWAASTLFIQSPVAVISPVVNTTYTLTGTDIHGCSKKVTITQLVDACTGINKVSTSLTGVKVSPNPTTGMFTVESNSTLNKTIEVVDLTGKVIMSATTKEDKFNVNINNLSDGIYYVKIKSNDDIKVVKVVKQ